MCCSNCKYLDVNNKKEGKTSGCKYYCKLNQTYLTADTNKCDHFDKAYRSIRVQEELEQEGKDWYDSEICLGRDILFAVFLIVLGLILGVFNI